MVRSLTVDDAPWVKEIYKQCRLALGSFNLYQCWDKYIEGSNNERFIGITGVGFVRWAPSKKYGGNIVHDIGVNTQHRFSGYGTKLLKEVPLPIILKCNQDNVRGNSFYKALGFVKAGVTSTRKGVAQNIWTLNKW